MRRDEPAGTGSTPNSNSTSSRVQLRAVGFRVLHPVAHCAWCGSGSATLRTASILWTAAPGAVCEDTVACARRRYWRAAA